MKIFLTILAIVLIVLAATYLCLRFYFAYKDSLEVQKAYQQLEELKTQTLPCPPPQGCEIKNNPIDNCAEECLGKCAITTTYDESLNCQNKCLKMCKG